MRLEKEPIINVGILSNTSIEFELKGNFYFNDQLIADGEYKALLEKGQISTLFAKNKKIILIPSSLFSTFILKSVTIGIGFHWEQKETQEFEGGLTLQIEEGKIRAINTVPLESYLKSVISSEMSAMNDLNLLKVHAIVSRSWLLAQIRNKSNSKLTTDYLVSAQVKNQYTDSLLEVCKWYDREDHQTFDVCADDHCQRYQGITKVISKNAQKAVDATRGMVLTYNNKICDARFSKCCGGITEDFKNVWQSVNIPYLTAIKDVMSRDDVNVFVVDDHFFTSKPEAFCNTSDHDILKQVLIDYDRTTTDFYRWTVEYSQAELTALLQKKSGINFGNIIDLIPLERGKSGRIIRLKIVGTENTIIVGKELEIRKWLSESHLYSSAFIVEKKYNTDQQFPSQFKLYGAGWGHGVGMCQIGAAVMSQKGYSVNEILSHYFTKSKLKMLYDE